MKGGADITFCKLTILAMLLAMASIGSLTAQVAADPEAPPQSGESPEFAGAVQDAGASALLANSKQPLEALNYVIGPEDVLSVSVFNVPELSRNVRVANDGTISLPLLGTVAAAGLTAQQLQDFLAAEYGRDYLQNPEISVYITGFHAQPVSVIGAVERPGLYNLAGPRTLIEVLSMAGGLAQQGTTHAGRSLIVTRRGGFGTLELVDGMRLLAADKLEIDLRRLLYSREAELNIGIRPLDTISVSTAEIVYVIGDVRRPTAIVMADREGLTVLQALAMAEGLNRTASKKSARIIRRSEDGSRVEIPVNLGKVLKGKLKDIELVGNDVLFVPDSTGKLALYRGLGTALSAATSVLVWRTRF